MKTNWRANILMSHFLQPPDWKCHIAHFYWSIHKKVESVEAKYYQEFIKQYVKWIHYKYWDDDDSNSFAIANLCVKRFFGYSVNKHTLGYFVVYLPLINHINTKAQFDFSAKECATSLCMGALAESIWKIHQWREDTPIDICENSCIGNLKGMISNLKWKWDAKFHCGNKASNM